MTTKETKGDQGDHDPKDARPDARRSAWAKVRELLERADAAIVEYQTRFAREGAHFSEHSVPNTPAHHRAQEKRQRRADSEASGETTYRDTALEIQSEMIAAYDKFTEADKSALGKWAKTQEAAYGSPIGVVNHHAMPWPAVFLAGRYGEEVEHWPTTLSDVDRMRLDELVRGRRNASGRLVGAGVPINNVIPLSVAVADKAAGRRVHLFAQEGHAPHVARADKLLRASIGKRGSRGDNS
jgi:hypothetical protein